MHPDLALLGPASRNLQYHKANKHRQPCAEGQTQRGVTEMTSETAGLLREVRRARSVALREAVAGGVWDADAVANALLGAELRLF